MYFDINSCLFECLTFADQNAFHVFFFFLWVGAALTVFSSTKLYRMMHTCKMLKCAAMVLSWVRHDGSWVRILKRAFSFAMVCSLTARE